MNTSAGQKILTDLNPRVHEKGFKAITTMVVAAYHYKRSKLYFAYAGHPPMLVWRVADPVWRPLEMEEPAAARLSDLPLGVLASTAYRQGSTPLNSGDRLLLFTDGVLECEDDTGEELGVAGLTDLLNESSIGNLSQLKTYLLRALSQRTAGKPLGDDVTFMFVEMTAGDGQPVGIGSHLFTAWRKLLS